MSKSWLLNFIKDEYAKVPKNLSLEVPPDSLGLVLERVEADELWSFVGSKKQRVWIWLGLDALTRQVIAVHLGGRSSEDAKLFWQEVPEPYRSGCDVYTDQWVAYESAIPRDMHYAVKKTPEKPAWLRESTAYCDKELVG